MQFFKWISKSPSVSFSPCQNMSWYIEEENPIFGFQQSRKDNVRFLWFSQATSTEQNV